MIVDTTQPLIAAALADARAQLATADGTDIGDDLALASSWAGLAVTFRRVLWVLNAEDDDTPDVAAQVAAEDGVPSIGVPYQRRGEQVAV
ncbi:hypothetical protein ACFCX0_03815 [Streptomyces sp. NPDC056352]|uniref:hypothetical protein n=1 Tax=Streptomyces sp. NPDC056352 TaxID=3345791 RepID=UPI0035DE1FEB